MVQESAYNVTQTDTPSKSNHAEANILPTEVDDHPVPEPVFTLDLDIEASCQDLLLNENNIPIEKPLKTNYQQFVVNNPTHLPSSFQNGITSHTSTIVNVYPQEQGNNSPPQPNYLQNNLPSDNEENADYYEIHTENTNATENNHFIPIVSYSRDKIVDSDVQEGWERIQPDIIPDHGPFTDNEGLNMSTDSYQSEDFFQ